MPFWTTLFGTEQHVDLAQECARAILVLAYGLVLVRVAGRRIFGKWSAIDIIVSVIVGSNLSRTITGNSPLAGTIAATTVLVAAHWLLAKAASRWPTVSYLIEGRGIDIVTDGKVNHRRRREQAVSVADLDETIRGAGLDGVEQARRITLEPSGKFTVERR